jgi:hypothetical protein
MAEVIGTFSTDATLFRPAVAAELARQADGTELTVFVPTDRACAARGIRRLDDTQAARLLRSHAFKGTLFDAQTLAYLEPGGKDVFALGWRAAGTEAIRRIENGASLTVANLDGRRVTLSVSRGSLHIRGYGSAVADSGFSARDGGLVAVDDCRTWDGSPASPHAP